jgi:hypothetical protein
VNKVFAGRGHHTLIPSYPVEAGPVPANS